MSSTSIKRTIAITLSGAAIAGTIGAPAASAMPMDPVHSTGGTGDVPIVTPAPRQSAPVAVAQERAVGFDLSSAAIGAAAGTGLLIVVSTAGELASSRRPMSRRHGAAGV